MSAHSKLVMRLAAHDNICLCTYFNLSTQPGFAFYIDTNIIATAPIVQHYKDKYVHPVHYHGTTWGNCLSPETR